MPQAPNVEGLPQWMQIAVSITFVIVTLVIAARGYKSGTEPTVTQPNATIAHLADMGAVRHLSDVCHQLHGAVVSLERAIEDQTHFMRSHIEVEREICQRLRELRERLDRGGGLSRE